MNKVFTVCYNELDVFEDLASAKSFYKNCYYSSEGAEQARYASVLIDLESKRVASDGVSYGCNSIGIVNKDWMNKGAIKVRLANTLSIVDVMNYYDENIEPILKLADEYGIDFNSKIPFEYFGSDTEATNMSSFSDFYGELLKKYSSIENIITNEVSDGKYEMKIYPSVGDLIIVDLCAWDNLDVVVDNFISIKDQLNKEKELGELE